ncbi:MAG: transglutaminaseTgpA domain-containing protein, partial [Acidimicrobiales bacterium]
MTDSRDLPAPSISAELSLLALSVVTVVGMSRLFVDNSIVPYLLTTAVLAHGVAAGMRRLKWPLLPVVAFNAAALLLLLVMSRYPDTLTWRLIPTKLTWSLIDSDLSEAWAAFGIVRAPTETLAGFVTVSIVAIWLLVQLADTAAFRMRTTVEAIVPMGTIFIFTSVLDNDRFRLPATVFFLAAVLSFALTHRGRARAQVAGTHEPLHTREIRSGAGIALASIAVAALLGPMLPGVDEEPLLNWRQLDGAGGNEDRVTLSPLVDARGRLVGQSDRVLFTVESDTRAYWRTTSLDTFDGVIWGAKYSVSEVDGALPADEFNGETETFEQTIQIDALTDIWLPAAFSATNIESSFDNVRYESSSATLLLGGRDRTERGQRYTITSVSPVYDPDDLRAASTNYPQEIIDRYLPLPASFSSRARLLAEELTIDADNNYEKALAIQKYFREFTYDLNVAEGHSNRRIETFLDERRGYCEQFAGTMAAMARHLGIPARVAVGFTPGDEIRPGVFEVRGRYYHAWPELYFPGSGWVYFEPTPNRGAPGAESWTQGAEAQVSLVDPN